MGWKIKQAVRDTAPTVLVTVGAVSSPAPWCDRTGGTPHVLDSAAVVVSRRTRKGWTTQREHVCPGWADVWDVIDGLASAGRRVYVVAGRASDMMVQLHWWERVQAGIYSVWKEVDPKRRKAPRDGVVASRYRHPLVINGRPDIIGYSLGMCSFRWVSVTNWADLSIADAARQIGYPVPASADSMDKWESVAWPAMDQARVIHGYMRRLINWWLANGCGTWKDTPGSAAWSTFLRRGGDSKIIEHSEEQVQHMEGRACFGGRASCWFFGDIGQTDQWGEMSEPPPAGKVGFGIAGPVRRYDVRAMYPTLLRDETFPTKLLRRETRPTLGQLRVGLREFLAVAAVRIRTDRAIYPRRKGQGVEYPTGTFDTVLTTPELIQAQAAGELAAVWEIAWYTPGKPFAAWADWILGKRSEMKASGDSVGESVVKLLANSLSGRLARLRQGWTDRPRVIPQLWWGHWCRQDAESGKAVMFRALAGHVQESTRDEYRPGTLAACYSHLTAYGRVRMNVVRDICGKREVLWQDTDGLLVTDLGGERLEASAHFHPSDYGKMRLDRVCTAGRLFTAKHYWLDGAWTLCGIHDGFVVDETGTAHDVITTNPVRSADEPEASAVYRAVRHIDVTRIEPGIEVGADGWAIPPRAMKGEPPTRPVPGQRLIWPGEE